MCKSVNGISTCFAKTQNIKFVDLMVMSKKNDAKNDLFSKFFWINSQKWKKKPMRGLRGKKVLHINSIFRLYKC